MSNITLSLILELLNHDAIQAALAKAGKSNYSRKIIDLDPTKDKNAVYSIKLTKFFLEPRSGNDDQFYDILKSYFEKFLLFKNRKLLKGKDADLNSIKSFKDFHNLVDATEAELKRNKPADIVAKIADPEKVEDQGNRMDVLGKKIDKKDITYIDPTVVVIRADNSSKSKRYGGGFSNWCTARKTGNLFYDYRFKEPPQTMFYVYFLNKNKNDNELVLHFGVDEDRDISYTDRLNKEITQTLDWLVKKFPELKPALDKNAFELVPLTATEIRVKKLPDTLSVEQFNGLSYDEKEMWFMSGDREATLEVWNLMDENFKNLYVREFSDRENDINYAVYDTIKGTKYEKLYMEGIQERIEDGISESETHTIDKCSPHDWEFIKTSPGLINKLNCREGIYYTLFYSPNKKETASLLGAAKIDRLSDWEVKDLIDRSQNKEEMIEIILQYKGNKLSDDNVYNLLQNSSNKEEMIKFILQYKGKNLTDSNVNDILTHSKNKEEMIEIILKYTGNNLSDNNVNDILTHSKNKEEMIKIILQYKGNNLTDSNVNDMLKHSQNKEEMIKFILNYTGNQLTDSNVESLFWHSKNKKEFIKIVLHYNGNNLTSTAMRYLVVASQNKEEMIKIILKYTGNKLTDENVDQLIAASYDEDGCVDGYVENLAKIFVANKHKFSESQIMNFLYSSRYPQEIARILGQKNINKLSESSIFSILSTYEHKETFAKLLITYIYPNRMTQFKLKFPEYRELLNVQAEDEDEWHPNYKSYFK
jgi:uncharacterized protein YneF (UPF0154 family)